MKKQRNLSLLAMLVIPILLFLLFKVPYLAPKTYQAEPGPESGALKTSGVFKPGGYIEFSYSPGIESIKGLYRANIHIIPRLSTEQENKGLEWPEFYDLRKGKKWGDELSSKTIKTFTVTTRMDIPRDPLFGGETIFLWLSYDFIYPEISGMTSGVNNYTFSNSDEDRDEKIMISIKNEQLTPDEIAWLEADKEPSNLMNLVGLVLFFLWFYAFYKFIGSFK